MISTGPSRVRTRNERFLTRIRYSRRMTASTFDMGLSRHRRDLARRGELLDRTGRVIATSAAAYRLYVDPAEVEDLDTIARMLSVEERWGEETSVRESERTPGRVTENVD